MSDAPVVTRVKVKGEPIDASSLLAEVSRSDAGAVVLFLGTARDHSPGKAGITHLEYEAYPEMVESKIAEVLGEAIARWDLLVAAVEHRVGMVAVGEPSVAVAVSAAHRDHAFLAARYLIDELKARAPIWKKEHRPGGGEWVEGA
ncbi:MAG: molybdenum cofactor biosynthesis protein MoaE [Acidimicrobiia bacterium]|nr:molybdenum cofactor biosynthesis protein MoaE [Acidimicrobiia bacterium]